MPDAQGAAGPRPPLVSSARSALCSLPLSTALARAKYKTAATDLLTWDQSVQMYRMEKGECPKTTQDLLAAGIIPRIIKDPWGSDYVFTCPGEHGKVDISSPGQDRELETADDVNSWDEHPGEMPDD